MSSSAKKLFGHASLDCDQPIKVGVVPGFVPLAVLFGWSPCQRRRSGGARSSSSAPTAAFATASPFTGTATSRGPHPFGGAAHQPSFKSIDEIADEEWELTFKVNIHAMFYLCKAAVPHMNPGSAIINTTSINADVPNPTLLAYAATKGAVQNFTAGLAQLFADKGIRANCVALRPRLDATHSIYHGQEGSVGFGKSYPMSPAGGACH